MTARSLLLTTLLCSACIPGSIGDPPQGTLIPLAVDDGAPGDANPGDVTDPGDATDPGDGAEPGDPTDPPGDTDCVPDWQDDGPCDCTADECDGCDGDLPQTDGCGNTREVPCTLEPTCERDCCAGLCCNYGDICVDDICVVDCWDECHSGERFCQDNTPWLCGENDGDECRDKMFGPECSGTTPVCDNATCVCSATSCTGGKICNGQICVNAADAVPDMVVYGSYDPDTQILHQIVCNEGDTFNPGPTDYHVVGWYMADPPGSPWIQVGGNAQHSASLADEAGECIDYDGIGPGSWEWFDIPLDRPLGMRFVIDPEDIFDESDETNNEWSEVVCLDTCP